MLLKYELGVVGEQNVHRALAGIERRFVQHNARIARVTGQKSGPAKRRSGGGVDPEITRSIRQQEQYWQRAHQRSADHRIRQDNRATAVALRNADREAKARTRAEAKAAKESMAARRKFSGAAFGTVGRSVKGTLAATGAIAGTTLGLAGGFAAAGAVQAEMSERAQASRLANQAGDPGSKGQLLKESRQVKGFSGGETLSAIEGFVTKTGDLGAARGLVQDLGALALATGTDFGEMGEAAGQAFNVIKDTIKDPQERLKAVNEVMRGLAAQGNIGAVEIRDMVTELAGLGAATRRFEGGPVGLLKTAGAMAQASVARGGSATAAEATTAVTRFSDDIINKNDTFSAAGIDTFVKGSNNTKLRGPEEIMGDVLEKTGGDMKKIGDMFGIYAARAVGGFSPLFVEAEKKKKGSGRAAVDAEFKKYRDATVSDKDIAARAASRLEDPDLQFKEIMKDFNQAIGTELLPVLTQLIPQFSRLLPYAERMAHLFGRVVEQLATDPFGGLASIVAAKLAFDIAVNSAASAGKRLTDSLTGVADGVNSVSSNFKAGAMGLELGLAAATIIVTSGIINFEKGEADMKSSGAALNIIREFEAKAKAGTATAADQERARVAQELIRKNEEGAKKVGAGESAAATALSLVSGEARLGMGGIDVKKGGGWFDSDKVAETLANPSRQTNVNTQTNFSNESEKLMVSAANALQNAAKSLAAVKPGEAPNRGNAPSPVKN